MLHARDQSTTVLKQQHVDRLHRHAIHTTSAGMAHANGPTARCHFSTWPLFFRSYNEVFVQTAFVPYYLSTDIYTSYVYNVPVVVLLLLLPLFLSLYLSLSLFKGTSHNNIAISLPTLLIFAATTKCLYKRHLFPTSLLARIIFRFVTTGLILCTPFYATD